ncbi:glycoside hydrolase N-terminal domain-containing protein [Streptomyces sp. DT2A-34]|uniref:glycosyl hydrolase family 95 catalytic domain-containing protein n=1 Tax=Streptomyces sp. DT2A-34 TaxID=3051182 RepID=UPI00265BFD7F|nr:glycoside hydrolase N-terminal domain-containing protein [Streptomyces sp. DT2A-34]MDO0911382.1 glycoside hydrolase N-terminal domain-containing protein [Streptomyces sp. DT2A-34]
MSGPVHGIWDPTPAARWEDAFLSGNGRHGVMVFGDPNADRIIVNHHTLVRPNGSEHARPPALAAELPQLQDRLLAGDVMAAERFTDGRELQWVQPFHPAFQIRLRRPVAEERENREDYRREVDFATGVCTAMRGGWRSQVFVSRADDVIVQYVTEPGLTADVTLDPQLPGAPYGLAVGHSAVLTPDGALLTLRVRYPGSDRAYTGVTLALVTGGSTRTSLPGIRVEGARSLLLLTRVQRHTGELDALAEARALRALLPDGDEDPYDRLLARHTALHRPAYLRAGLDLGADDAERALPGSELASSPKSPALLERLFAAGRYHLLSAAGMLPPRLTGLWTGDWNTAWSGAFTTDANLNLQTASAAAAALPEVTEAHAALIHGQLDHWRDNARTIFGTRGVVAPAHTDGESGHLYHFSREYPLHLWTAGADWLLKPLVDHDETRGDRDSRTAAVLAEAARFYEDFLTRSDDDGHVVVVPSYSPENRPANASWVTLNAAMDLSAARHALLTAADYHPDTPDADRWRTLADRLPPHRINEDGALAEWAWPGLADTYDHRHLSHLYGVWPLDEITPYDTPALAAAAHRALELRGAENDSAHGHLHHALIAARLRDAARVAHALDQVLGGDFFHASLMSAHYPKRDVYNADAAHTLPAVLIEMLVQSTPDRLVLLPALPPTLPQGRLRGVRTRFGAEVDLTWTPDGATAVLRPSRTVRIELRTSSGDGDVRPLDLVAGEDHVLTLGAW